MGRSFGGLCKAGQRKGDCLSLLDDAMGLREWDKLGVALGLSLDPMKESIARAVENTLAPQLFYAVISTGLVTWAVMAANPEPVFTKAAAIVSAVLLIYLGLETFLEVVEASRELKRTTDRATMPQELEQAGQRFANRVGPQVARVFVLAVTVVVTQGMTGGAALLASRLSMLPRFPEAAAVGASQVGISLANVGQVTAVAVMGSTVVISLPATAIAMVARGMSGGPAASSASGQLHHVISKRIAEKLKVHATLRGHYTARDPRFVTRAADKAAHNGYQKWHRDVDREVVDWLDSNIKAIPREFEAFLRSIYNRPEMRLRFPDGF
jgi:TRAP-type C4-dicarboxylate transport system permease small subunit